MLANIGLELAYFSGAARIVESRTGGAGVILRFEHVRPRLDGRFQPLKSYEITPQFLESAVLAFGKWGFDILSIDDAIERAQRKSIERRFVCLTFDGGHRDFMTHAYPLLSKHRAPFALYIPTGFVDGIGKAWWLALEQVVARHTRIGLVIDRAERHFNASSLAEKYQLYDYLHGWLHSLPPADLAAAIGDLCGRYSVDLDAVSRDTTLTWQDLAKLARDPQATIGSATVNYPNLAKIKGSLALREMTMGRTVLETALDHSCRHFAYPFGEKCSFGARDLLLAREAGFVSAVTAHPGVIGFEGQSNLMALPRIGWDGRSQSLRVLRVLLSGITTRSEPKPAPEAPISYS